MSTPTASRPSMSRYTQNSPPSSSESAHRASPTDPLSPPRPFFLSQDSRRSSDSSSLSDSGRDSQVPLTTKSRISQARRRSGMDPSSGANQYAPVSSSTPTSAKSPASRRNSNPFEHEAAGYTHSQDGEYAPLGGAGTEDYELSPTWNASALYHNDIEDGSTGRGRSSRPPPSSFQFPFQAYPGNPDPIPRRQRSRSSSVTSQNRHAFSESSHDSPAVANPPPTAFMDRGRNASTSSLAGNGVYRGSAIMGMMSGSQTALASEGGQEVIMQELRSGPSRPFANEEGIPRTSSQPSFRAPFLSPASRPSSSFWTPPTYPYSGTSTMGGSSSALALPGPRAPAPSTRIAAKLTKEDKPWLQRAAPRARVSWWMTLFCMFLGVVGSAFLCYFGITGVDRLTDNQLCSVLDDNFDTFDLTNTWTRDVQLGGFGNAEFQIASSFDNNSYVSNGELYIMPTLTSDWLGDSTVNSGTITLNPCTEALTNATACTASGNGVDQVINPIMSARISTKDHYSMTYGRIEVRAKLPRGDWLWPAIWMLPTSGTWPVDGEIDIMEARGNGLSYGAQGSNFVRSTVQYGPFAGLVHRLFGWYSLKRAGFNEGFHTYGLEWDDKFMRFYVDSRIHTALDLTTKNSKSSFWNRAGFPQTAQNGSAQVVVQNPYKNLNSPFDQPFYLIIDLAVGGTSGWFPDSVGGKPWFDGSLTAMSDFWKAKNTWYPTWPKNAADGAFRIDYVKMWKKC